MCFRHYLHVLLTVLVLTGFVCAQSGTVIKTIPAPNYPYGLAYDGQYLWVGTSYANNTVLHKVDPADGSVVATIPAPNATGFFTIKALAYDGTNLWVFNDLPSASHPDKFYKIDPADGTILKTIDSPENNYIGGMTYSEDHIWYTQYFASNNDGKDVIIKMDTTGVPVDTIVSVGEQPMGIIYDGGFYWCAEDTGFGATRQEIYQYDGSTGLYTGTFIRNPTASPRDAAWDGSTMWLVSYNTTNSILYQIDLGGSGTPMLNLPVTDLQFALTEIGQTRTNILNVINDGSAPLEIDTITSSNAAFSIDGLTFPLTIDAGNSVALAVDFTPAAFGVASGILTLQTNDPLQPTAIVSLNGKGLYSDPTIFTAVTSHDYGDVWVGEEGSGIWHFDVVNQGIQNLSISGASTNDQIFKLVAPAPPLSVAPDDTVEFAVRFTPPMAQSYQGTLTIVSNDPQQGSLQITLQGNGLAGPFDIGYRFWNYQIPDNPATSFNEHRVLGLKSIPDVNDDGWDDVVVASRNYWTICFSGGSSGPAEELWRFSSYFTNFSAGGIGGTNELPPQQRALAIAEDLNGDGNFDVVIGTGGGNEHVYALDGTNGGIIWEYGTNAPDSFGLGDFSSVSVETDYNNDGVKDVLAAASASASGGLDGRRTVYCFDGTNGNIIWQYFTGAFTREANVVGDLNGNGSEDIIIVTGEGLQNSDVAVAVDPAGPTGPTPIWSFPLTRDDGGGKTVEILQIPGETPDILAGQFFDRVWRIDGETGTEVWEFNLNSLSAIHHLTLVPDQNGDGIEEIGVSNFTSTYFLLSGADGSIVWQKTLGGASWSAEVVYQSDGTLPRIAVASRSDQLYYLDALDGSVWLQQALGSGTTQGATLVYSMPDLDNNLTNDIIVASDGGQVYAVSSGEYNIVDGIFDNGVIPQEFRLLQNYPNPFNPSTTIQFELPSASVVTLEIYDVMGRHVETPYRASLPMGTHKYVWNATDANGHPVVSGIYFYRLQAGDHVATRKMILMR